MNQICMAIRTAKATVELLESNSGKGSLKEQAARLARLEKAKEELDRLEGERNLQQYLEETGDQDRTDAYRSLLGY